jgi:hypothetical protein
MLDRCGPKPSMIFRSLAGSVAIVVSRRPRWFTVASWIPPQRALRQSEQRAATTRADLLIVFGPARWIHLVCEAELALDRHQVADHLGRGIWLLAPTAPCLLACSAHLFVEADTKLRRMLKDMKELPEREVEQRHDDCAGVQDRQKILGVTFHPRVAGGE